MSITVSSFAITSQLQASPFTGFVKRKLHYAMVALSATTLPSLTRPQIITSIHALQARICGHHAISRTFLTPSITHRPSMEDSQSRDFAGASNGHSHQQSRGATIDGASSSRVSYDIEANAPIRRNFTTSSRIPRRPSLVSSINTHDDVGRIHRIMRRANTIVHYHNDQQDPLPPTTQFEHGAEPGIDTRQDYEPEFPTLGKTCQTTVVDFSEDKMEKHEFDNDDLIEFLQKPRADWAKTRWINVNGLSWSVIKALGNRYKLHRLAVEDLLNTRGRAKVDWYPDNVYG